MSRMKKAVALLVAVAFVLGAAGMAFSSGSAPEGNLKLKGGKITAVDNDASTITVKKDDKDYVFEVAEKYLKKAKVGVKIKYVKYSEHDGKLVASKVKFAKKRRAVQGC